MALYQYIKSLPQKNRKGKAASNALYQPFEVGLIGKSIDTQRSLPKRYGQKGATWTKVVSLLLMALGSGVLLWVVWPIVSFVIYTGPFIPRIVSPIDKANHGSVQTAFFSPIVSAAEEQISSIDSTNANIWYPTSPQKKVVTPVNTYTISIPKLGISEARVVIAGDDLTRGLIHYGGTSLPGEYGTTVIFGHSVLPQFFDPHNYKTIFSTLPTIKPGDDIFITYDNVDYRYRVYDMEVTEPNDLSSLEQNFSDSYVTLITCVPPGTFWKRLNVKARLVKN